MPSEFVRNYSENSASSSRPETIIIINCALNAPLMLMAIAGNTLVLAAILRTPSLRSPTTILLCSLAVSDLLVGLVVQPVYVAFYLTENAYLHNVKATMGFTVCAVSLFTMTAIAVDRFLALHYHMRYPNIMTTIRAMYLSATLWIVAFLLSFLRFWDKRVYAVTIAVIIVCCLLICSGCYVRIYRIVLQHQLKIQLQQQAMANFNAENNQNMQQSTRSAKNTFIYYILMVLCYIPVFISWSILAISPNQWTIQWTLADTLLFMNSSINPFLYCWRLRELRAEVLKTTRQVLCKDTAQY